MGDQMGAAPLPPPSGPRRVGPPPRPAGSPLPPPGTSIPPTSGSSLPPPMYATPSPAQVAQQAVRHDPPMGSVRGPMAPKATQRPAAADASPSRRGGRGGITVLKVGALLAVVVAAGAGAGTALSNVDAVVAVQERADLPGWMPFAVAGGVLVAGLFALMIGGPRPELVPSWAGLVLITYGSGLGLDRLQTHDGTGLSGDVLAQLDTTTSIMLAGGALVLLGQALAIKRFLSPRPIAAVRALLGTGVLSALAIAVVVTSSLSAEVIVGEWIA